MSSQSSIYPLRTRIAGDIVAEVMLPTKQTGNVAVIATGLPSSPEKRELLDFLARQGYVTVLPRYRGTWESGGYFLDHSPADDIRDVIDTLVRDQSVIDIATRQRVPIRVRTVHLFGSSFGGPAVLLNSRHPIVKKVIAISPVLDWSVEGEDEPFDQHVQFVVAGFGGVYRVREKRNWNKLVKTNFYNPLAHTNTLDGKKIFILHAEDDRIVPHEPLFDFIHQTGAKYYLKPHGGHRLRIVHQFLWKKIDAFLRER